MLELGGGLWHGLGDGLMLELGGGLWLGLGGGLRLFCSGWRITVWTG